ncbi:hypothetical protein [Vibrio bivalvicida]|uniref:Lipoprotein n=1 Tax=Vibrio bivalvicida TaxID=1276888 RepID=A0ABV4MM59_9VIBR
MNLRYRLMLAILGFGLLSGCSSKPDGMSSLVKWDKKWQECNAQGRASTALLPESDWFDSLSIEDKKHVIVFINKQKQYECTKDEATQLKLALNEQEIQTINNLLKGFVYFDAPSSEDVKHLNQEELKKLSDKASLFDLHYVAKSLELI